MLSNTRRAQVYGIQHAKIQKNDIRIKHQGVTPDSAQFGTLKYLTPRLLCAHSMADRCLRVSACHEKINQLQAHLRFPSARNSTVPRRAANYHAATISSEIVRSIRERAAAGKDRASSAAAE
jgi:hypothetical protein